MDRPVVTQTTESMYLSNVWHNREHGRCRAEWVPQCAHLSYPYVVRQL